MKKILIVVDGLGDKPIFDGLTPLEKADTPILDRLAKEGVVGSVETYHAEGALPTSEGAHLAIFGHNEQEVGIGRGIIEVLGMGMDIQPGDIGFRGNFATIKDGLIVDRRAGRIEETEELVAKLQGITIEGIKFFVKRSVSHRIGIVMRGEDLSDDVSGNDSKEVNVPPLKITGHSRTARILDLFLDEAARRLSEDYPANYVLVRGAGVLKELPKWENSACIAGGPLYKGIGRLLGMDMIDVPGANALPTTNLDGKISATIEGIKKYDFIFCHIKAPDNLAEDGDYEGKKEFIAKMDKSLAPLLNLEDVKVIVTADHSTSSLDKKHSTDNVPVLSWVKGVTGDSVDSFSENKVGDLGIIPQIELLSRL